MSNTKRDAALGPGAAALLGAVARAALVMALTLAPAAARAQATGSTALGEALFREGRRLMSEGKIAEACDKFVASQRADPAVGTLLNVAACHEKAGRTATAWGEFSDAAAAARAAGKPDREAFARAHAAALEKKLHHITIEVAAPAADLTVKLDGQPVAREAWGTPLPVDPGERAVEAAAPGREPWSRKLAIVDAAGTERVDVPTLAELPAPPPAAPVVAAALPVAPIAAGGLGAGGSAAVAEPARRTARQNAGIVVAGAGLVAVGVGAVFGLRASGKLADSRGHCTDDVCDSTGGDLNAQAKSAATVSTVAFGVGLAAVAGGALLYFLPQHVEGHAVAVAPSVSDRGAGFVLAASF